MTPNPASAAARSPLKLPLMHTMRQGRAGPLECGENDVAGDAGRRIEDQRHRRRWIEARQIAGHPDQPVAPDHASAILSRRTFAADEVKLAARELLVELTAQADRELEFDQRMAADKLPQHFRQQRRHEILRRAEPQPAAQFGAGEIALRPFVRRQDAAGEFDHGLSVRRHRDRMGVADEQPASGLVLQLADVLADRRLAQAEPLGGPGETPGLRDRQEGLKQDGIQHGFASGGLCHHNLRLQ